MTTVLGIIAEYDPFHNGHLHHLKKSMEQTGAGASVCVMSGPFTQRGRPAMWEKRRRAAAAVRCGVDLVLELPFVYAAGNAESFAYGAVRLLNALGAVDYISFGSESGDIGKLSEVAALLASEKLSLFHSGGGAAVTSELFSALAREDAFAENARSGVGIKSARQGAPFTEAIRAASAEGLSYPAARERAVASLLGEEAAALLREPNNILGIEYLKQLKQMESAIKALTIPRYAASVNEADETSGIAGATAIRRMIAEGESGRAASFMPPAAAELLFGGKSGAPRVLDDALFPMLCRAVAEAEAEAGTDALAQAAAEAGIAARNIAEAEARAVAKAGTAAPITSEAEARAAAEACNAEAYSAARLSEILSATEGLENRLAKAVRSAPDIDSAVRQTKTKRYTETRVRRLILHTVFGLTKEKMAIAAAEAPYARVLAMNGRGARLITTFRRVSDTALITNANRSQNDLARAPVTFAYDIKAAETWQIMATGSLNGCDERRAAPVKISECD